MVGQEDAVHLDFPSFHVQHFTFVGRGQTGSVAIEIGLDIAGFVRGDDGGKDRFVPEAAKVEFVAAVFVADGGGGAFERANSAKSPDFDTGERLALLVGYAADCSMVSSGCSALATGFLSVGGASDGGVVTNRVISWMLNSQRYLSGRMRI